MSPERMLSLLLEQTRDVVFTLDGDGRISSWNAGAERVLGWSASEAIGTSAIALLSSDEWIARAHELLADVRGGAPIEGEFHVRAKDGTARLVRLTAVPGEGPTVALLAVATDLSERERLADKLAAAARLDQLPLIASGVSHDLNNLLAVVGAGIELASRQMAHGLSPERALGEATCAVQRAAELNHRLAALSRGDAPLRTPTSLAGIVRDTASFSLVGRATELECEICEELWVVEADPGQISQVVQNLVTNAADAMQSAGRVRVEAANVLEPPDVPTRLHPGPHVVLRVRDHGIGIAPEDQQRVFDPFFTTKPRGSGLGLATSASIVRAHEGFVRLESAPGVGSTFEIWLPATPRIDAASEAERDHRARTS